MRYTFEELPQTINTLHEKVDGIKDPLLENRSQNPQRPRDDLLTIKQAAEFLSLSVHPLHQSEPEGNPREQAGAKDFISL